MVKKVTKSRPKGCTREETRADEQNKQVSGLILLLSFNREIMFRRLVSSSTFIGCVLVLVWITELQSLSGDNAKINNRHEPAFVRMHSSMARDKHVRLTLASEKS